MRFDKDAEFDQHPCNPVFKMVDGKLTAEVSEVLKLKRTRWGRFMDKLFSMDISFGLAVIGLTIVNGVIVGHFGFTIKEAVLEGLGIGLAIPRLIK